MIGSFTVMFVATIMIVLILVVFVLGSGVIKKLDNAKSGVSILSEEDVGLEEVFSYMLDYKKLTEFRFKMEESGLYG
jgi:hypothetical protein